ncbi:MAG TPA: histidinol dehydrogenase [Syntrophales bacterium]|nr:histidinol dehydrogenase [Syntrophales bacterium]HOX94190.1 histidinol dehydrogenase [Syntrophales bacterium]HPI57694.1 histidinol dehydrogenase [Syntrophales bacterium]HPN23927.1 histidinol dehydrogenase [Syntrophales bacterium]HQM28205.1 histidinol dehydrogenase [Syntrophales bacterium]
MKIIGSSDRRFKAVFDRMKGRGRVSDRTLENAVRKILDDVRRRGDRALFKYGMRFDGVSLDPRTIEVLPEEIREALSKLDKGAAKALKLAARRIERYHRRQIARSWSYIETTGIELGQEIRPLERVGIYAPGGLAAYPSTVLMAAMPARIAGVREVILATPPGRSGVNPFILAAAAIAGVDRVFKMGGAQAIAALAYGTESVPAVDKIVGPGNAYVAMAKRMVFGSVGIDMIAGPSEIMIVCDGKADPVVIAADLLAQAEHDELASAILLTTDRPFARSVAREVDLQLGELSRRGIARKSIEKYGLIVLTADIDEALFIVNRFAPEHLELVVADPKRILRKVRNAGAVFLGPNTPEVLGDYLAGPNHILPTGGTARFSSPLGVYDFVKRTSLISFTAGALEKYGAEAETFARLEGLEAHGRAIAKRLKSKKS